jgi:hypothetical protein
LRTESPDRTWRAFQAYEDLNVTWQSIGDELTIDTALSHYRPPGYLMLSIEPCALAEDVRTAVLEGIPEGIRHHFLPCRAWLTIGEHDIFEAAENYDGTYFGRAVLSIRFVGYHTPHDWAEFRRLVFDLPAIVAVRQRIEAAIGPVKTAVHWDM